MMTLSRRLKAIAHKVMPGSRMADIGSDHALLPVYLVQAGRIRGAVAGEINPGPMEAARRQVAASGLSERIDVRRGDGLAVLAPGEAESVVIAGMGGGTIVAILTEGADKLEGVGQLVLQPNVGEDLVRRWLYEQGWWLAEETILEEDGKIYEILAAERAQRAAERNRALYDPRRYPGIPRLTVEELLAFGPYLLETAGEVWLAKWTRECDKWRKILRQMERSDSPETAEKAEETARRIARLEEVMACSQKDRRSGN